MSEAKQLPNITVDDILIAADQLEELGHKVCDVLRDPLVAQILADIRGPIHEVRERYSRTSRPGMPGITSRTIQWVEPLSPPRCHCKSMAHRLAGDGCEICQPERALALMEEQE
jgi:hypothetical protein